MTGNSLKKEPDRDSVRICPWRSPSARRPLSVISQSGLGLIGDGRW